MLCLCLLSCLCGRGVVVKGSKKGEDQSELLKLLYGAELQEWMWMCRIIMVDMILHGFGAGKSRLYLRRESAITERRVILNTK